MEIDRGFLETAIKYFKAHGGKLGRNAHIYDLLSDGLATSYFDRYADEVAQRCMHVLRAYWNIGLAGGAQRKEYQAVLEYLGQLKDNPTSAIEYHGKIEKVRAYLQGKKQVEQIKLQAYLRSIITEGGLNMKKVEFWLADSINSVTQYILDNIRVLEVLKQNALVNGDNETADNIIKTIEAYQRAQDGVAKLQDTMAERQTDVLPYLKAIKKLVVSNRADIRGGEFAANLDFADVNSCFAQINAQIEGALAVYQVPNGKKPVAFSGDAVKYNSDNDFLLLLGYASKRKTYDELCRNIEKQLQPKGMAELERRQANLESQYNAALNEGREIKRKVQAGLLTQADGALLLAPIVERMKILKESIDEVKLSISDIKDDKVGEYGLWSQIINTIGPFVSDCTPVEFMCYADDIIEAMRSVSGFLFGTNYDGKLDSVQACIDLLTRVRTEDEEKRAIYRSEMKKSIDAAKAMRTQIRERYSVRTRETPVTTNPSAIFDEFDSMTGTADVVQLSAEDRALDPDVMGLTSNPNLFSNNGSINDDD